MKKLSVLLSVLACSLLLTGCLPSKELLALAILVEGTERANADIKYYSENTPTFRGKVLSSSGDTVLVELDEDDPLYQYGETITAHVSFDHELEKLVGLTYEFSYTCLSWDENGPIAEIAALWIPPYVVTEEEFLEKVLSTKHIEGIWQEMSYEEYSASFTQPLAVPEYLPENYKRHETVYVSTHPQSGELMLVEQLWYNAVDEVFFELKQQFFNFYPIDYSCKRLPDYLVLDGELPFLGRYYLTQGKSVGDVGVIMHMRVTNYYRAEFEEIFDAVVIP